MYLTKAFKYYVTGNICSMSRTISNYLVTFYKIFASLNQKHLKSKNYIFFNEDETSFFHFDKAKITKYFPLI